MKALKIVDRTLETLTIITFVGIIISVMIQILSRYLPYSAVWTEELTRFLFIYSVSFAAPLALKKKEYINLDIIINLLPYKVRNFYYGFIYLLIVILCSVIAFQGYTFAKIGLGQSSATMAIDMSIIHSSIGISMVFVALYAFFHMLDHFKGTQSKNGKGV
ncbi:TRAP-type C4-dicarboxylate transport system permease small subunit [Caldalkalibacillus uzonensis]|uniref:TRAP-type C4-dicarboxylate transport system permease small subunit n=1 Tax=Caldalkalibacillus uzonensis TaxID=353224 RepID=A0ABU0CQ64_9BACI|nr:TRAP transporter small permease subunit [Caldalkalibacillus uzonensis]MDQ0338041.1 TRAP-type C4-dicarboxylate transport system permease small subunit [Caldalkalibacillus uzonensis]